MWNHVIFSRRLGILSWLHGSCVNLTKRATEINMVASCLIYISGERKRVNFFFSDDKAIWAKTLVGRNVLWVTVSRDWFGTSRLGPTPANWLAVWSHSQKSWVETILHPGKWTAGTWKSPVWKRKIIFHPPTWLWVPNVNFPGCKWYRLELNLRPLPSASRIQLFNSSGIL